MIALLTHVDATKITQSVMFPVIIHTMLMPMYSETVVLFRKRGHKDMRCVPTPPTERGPTSHDRATPLSIAFIGTYVPRRCGIATFTADLARAVASHPSKPRVPILAINDTTAGYDYPDEVEFEIRQNDIRDYRVAADYLNRNDIDALSVQHEFGIFGGPDGSHILELLGGLHIPVITTLHTVLRRPTPSQRDVVVELAAHSDQMVVMSETAKRFLVEIYGLDRDRIAFAPHGIPDLAFVDPNYTKDQFGVEGKKVIATFGLLSRNKGIETMIDALPHIIAAHPDTVYLVLGATHPHVKKTEGESYRHSLEERARSLGIEDNVLLLDRYLEIDQLCEFLGAADIFVTPYLDEDQITSGTLAYAMGAGKAVVSTPYWYATEMLDEGRGVVVPFGNSRDMAGAIIELFSDETSRHAMRKRAYQFSRSSTWAGVGERYLDIVSDSITNRRSNRPVFPTVAPQNGKSPVPDIDLSHLKRMTDDNGMFQHATYFVPHRDHGYCTDDNARALLVSTLAATHLPEESGVRELIVRYLAFLQHAYDEESGVFHNFMGFDRRWIAENRPVDSHGRALWALGKAAAEFPEEPLRAIAANLFQSALPVMFQVTDLRAAAFALLGTVGYLTRYAGDSAARRMREFLADYLLRGFEYELSADDWPWPEQTLTYANARLPQALLEAGRQMENESMIAAGLRSLSWLVKISTANGHFSPVGNDGWYPRGGSRALFDQQPLEADAMVAACIAAYHATEEHIWVDRATLCFKWFLGANDLEIPLYDSSTGGCRDGLSPNGVNENQGAESTLAWLSALTQIHSLQAAGYLGWTSNLAPEGVATVEVAS
jgi:glycosyltransferase involved in cell wall biosynthesis